MKLSHELGKIFESEMDAVIQKEIDDSEYLPQSDFESCEERATAMTKDATVAVIKTLGMSICTHRQDSHSEDHQEESDRLASEITNDQLTVGMAPFWNG